MVPPHVAPTLTFFMVPPLPQHKARGGDVGAADRTEAPTYDLWRICEDPSTGVRHGQLVPRSFSADVAAASGLPLKCRSTRGSIGCISPLAGKEARSNGLLQGLVPPYTPRVSSTLSFCSYNDHNGDTAEARGPAAALAGT